MTTPATLTLADWLMARIDEDEAVGRKGAAMWDGREEPPGLMSYRRVLAECEAKRRIVELHEPQDQPAHTGYGARRFCGVCGGDNAYESPCDTLLALASVYADVDGFRAEWRA